MEKETARAWFFRGLEASGDGSHSTFAKAMKIFNEEWEAHYGRHRTFGE
jgi:hypothetical protein